QGTAIRKNKNGNAKWRNHARPPSRYANKIEMITTASASNQLNKRQSGFASATKRIGKTRAAQNNAIAIAGPPDFGSLGIGRLDQRRGGRILWSVGRSVGFEGPEWLGRLLSALGREFRHQSRD